MAESSFADQELSISTEWLNRTTVRVHVAGEIDLATAPQLRGALLAAVEAVAPPVEIVVDMAGVRFIDAVGIGALISGRNAARPSGVGYSVRNPQQPVVRILDLLGLIEALCVRPPLDARSNGHRG